MTPPPAPPGGIHGGAVAIGGRGVLVRGASGSGKSALLLSLLLSDLGTVRLVADDRVLLTAEGGRLIARPAEGLEGLIEVRGQGLLAWPTEPQVAIVLCVDLVAPGESARMPERAELETRIEGVLLHRFALPGGQPDGAVRVRAALESWARDFHKG